MPAAPLPHATPSNRLLQRDPNPAGDAGLLGDPRAVQINYLANGSFGLGPKMKSSRM